MAIDVVLPGVNSNSKLTLMEVPSRYKKKGRRYVVENHWYDGIAKNYVHMKRYHLIVFFNDKGTNVKNA